MTKNITYHLDLDIELKRNPYPGLYIAFEGIDGAGKTTQVEHLTQYLEKKHRELVVTSEPRKEGSDIGILIHKILRSEVRLLSAALQYLYTAERIANHSEIIDPALEKGKVVISHRSLWSNLPYGMLDWGAVDFESNDARAIDMAHGLLSLYHQFMVPDITFYLRVSAKTAMERLGTRPQQNEIYEKLAKLEKISKGYEWQVKHYPTEFVVVDGEKNEDEVSEHIKAVVDKNIK